MGAAPSGFCVVDFGALAVAPVSYRGFQLFAFLGTLCSIAPTYLSYGEGWAHYRAGHRFVTSSLKAQPGSFAGLAPLSKRHLF